MYKKTVNIFFKNCKIKFYKRSLPLPRFIFDVINIPVVYQTRTSLKLNFNVRIVMRLLFYIG